MAIVSKVRRYKIIDLVQRQALLWGRENCLSDHNRVWDRGLEIFGSVFGEVDLFRCLDHIATFEGR